MEQLVAPLTKPECDLRDFAFMPLDVVRLRDSDIASLTSGEEFRCAVLLWCASWHQIPAASLPDDDIVLSKLAGFGKVVKEWKKVREGALRGWIKCDDGRLYHPVVAEKANEAWNRKLEQAWRTECGRIKKLNQRHSSQIPYPTLDDFLSPSYAHPKLLTIPDVSPGTINPSPQGQAGGVPDVSPGKCTPIDSGQGQGQGQGQGEVNTLKPVSVANATSGETAAQSPPDKPAAQSEKKETLTLVPDFPPMACPVEKLVGLYHELMPHNPRCRVLNQTRRKAIAARWKEASDLNTFPFKGGYDTQAKGLACWREFFAICGDSDFLTGKAQPVPGRPVFLADLDFLMSPSAFVKTLENKYHREVA